MPTPVSYQLQVPTPAPIPPPAFLILPANTSALGPSTPSFWGAGIIRPFRRDGKNDIANSSGLALIQSCVGQILGTRASNPNGNLPGELPWRPGFGSRLFLLKHASSDVIDDLARAYCAEALARWEPRVTNLRTLAVFDSTTLTITVDLVYDVITRNNASNQVVYANVQQTIRVAA
jgi:phage baseplate assembly protein W